MAAGCIFAFIAAIPAGLVYSTLRSLGADAGIAVLPTAAAWGIAFGLILNLAGRPRQTRQQAIREAMQRQLEGANKKQIDELQRQLKELAPPSDYTDDAGRYAEGTSTIYAGGYTFTKKSDGFFVDYQKPERIDPEESRRLQPYEDFFNSRKDRNEKNN